MGSDKIKRIETWVWVLIYAGMVVFGIGLALQRADASLAWPFVIGGALIFAIGVLLIWIRSRMTTPQDDPPQPEATP